MPRDFCLFAMHTANEKTVMLIFSLISETRVVMMRGWLCHGHEQAEEEGWRKACRAQWPVLMASQTRAAGHGWHDVGVRALEERAAWERISGLCLQLAATCGYRCSALWEQSSDNRVILAQILLILRASRHCCCYCRYSVISSLWLCDSELLSRSSSVGAIFLSRAVGRDGRSATTVGFCCLTAVSQKHEM